MFVPLYSLFRGDFEENRVFGGVCVDWGDGGSFCTSEEPGAYPARSILKPFQFLASGNPIEKRDRRARQAAAMGSPSATLDQIEQLLEWYGDENWEAKIRLPAAWPLDGDAACLLRDR